MHVVMQDSYLDMCNNHDYYVITMWAKAAQSEHTV